MNQIKLRSVIILRLFDLEQDPYEEYNLIGEQPDIAASLMSRLEEHLHTMIPPDFDPLALVTNKVCCKCKFN